MSSSIQIEALNREDYAEGQGIVFVAHYKLVRKLGEGAFGVAHLVEDTRNNNEESVLKRVKLTPAISRNNVQSEADILKNLNHPNLVDLHDHFLTRTWFCMVMEFCERGDLEKRIQNRRSKGRGPFHDDTIIEWTRQILEALKYIHKKNIIHRDLKPANILFTGDDTVKVADFGLSRQLTSNTRYGGTQAGTMHYMSPQILQEKPYGVKTDIWSLGGVIYDMCMEEKAWYQVWLDVIQTGKPPEVEDEILQELLVRTLKIPEKARSPAKRLLSDLWTYD